MDSGLFMYVPIQTEFPGQVSAVPVKVIQFMLCLLVFVSKGDFFLTLTAELGAILLKAMGPHPLTTGTSLIVLPTG